MPPYRLPQYKATETAFEKDKPRVPFQPLVPLDQLGVPTGIVLSQDFL